MDLMARGCKHTEAFPEAAPVQQTKEQRVEHIPSKTILKMF